MKLDSPPLRQLADVATVRGELKGPDVPAAARPLVAELLEEYPGAAQFTDYTELLENHGGLHAHNKEFDLILYGLTGGLVPSFDEGWFMTDDGSHFLFGEIMYPARGAEEVFLFFDVRSPEDVVWCRRDAAAGDFHRAADSLAEFFTNLAAARYPQCGEASGT